MSRTPVFLSVAGALAVVFSANPARITAAAGEAFARVCAWTAPDNLTLDEKKIAAQVDGVPARVLRVQGPGDSLMLLLVMDVAGDLALVDEARTALVADIRGLPPNAWVGVLRAQDGLKALVEPTADREKVVQALQDLPLGGRAGLLPTVETAEQLATTIAEKAPVRVAIFYVTDSDIYNYREDYTNPVVNRSDSSDLSRRFPDGLIREEISRLSGNLAAAKAPVFIVHLELSRQPLNEAYQNGLLKLADATGGSATLCRTRQEIAAAVANMLLKIRSLWTIDIALPPSVSRNYTISLEAGDAQLTYKNRFAESK